MIPLLRATPAQGAVAIVLGLALGPLSHAVAYALVDYVRGLVGPDLQPPSATVAALLAVGLCGQLIGALIVVVGLLAWRPLARDDGLLLVGLASLRAVAAAALWAASLDERFHLWSVSLALALPDAIFVAALLRHAARRVSPPLLAALAHGLAPAYVVYKVTWASFSFFPAETQPMAHAIHRVLALVLALLVVVVVARLPRTSPAP